MRIFSWNVNGIRAAYRKGLLEWILKEQPDVLCLQEIKALEDQLPAQLKNLPNYHVFVNPAERKGYSGVATFSKNNPVSTGRGLGLPRFDVEGRVLISEFDDFFLYNIYFPNGKKNQERLDYKLDFYNDFLDRADALKDESGKGIVVCGDFNTAHREVDLSRPKQNENRSGFLPVERAWIDTFIDHGYTDTWRHLNPKVIDRYSWWDQKTRSRERNVGWRIDYFFVSNDLLSKLKDASIHDDVFGSDHCPVSIEIEK